MAWRNDEFICEQIGEVDLSEKEPTVQTVSREKGFLGERCQLAVWDDLVVSANVRSLDIRNALSQWFGVEAETRIEPAGVMLLVGQRLGPDDLYRDRLDVQYLDEDGQEQRKYHHIVYPAHHEATCDGNHRQWDAKSNGDGCLLDAIRLPWKELSVESQTQPRRFNMIYQQEDVDDAGALVPLLWFEGGIDIYSDPVPGCWDKDRGFWEWPTGVNGLVDYACVDPSATGWWAIEHWACKDAMSPRHLIAGTRRKMGANELLDWRHAEGRHTGIMEDWQAKSVEAGHPIKVWIIESNAFARHLMQFDHFQTWLRKWDVKAIGHQTQRNKTDPKLGVEALLPGLYRDGMKRIPRKHGDLEALTFVETLKRELSQWPDAATTDAVMADWMGEYRLQLGDIMRLARRTTQPQTPGLKLPPYLVRQYQQVKV